jgi:hypothetical protein
VNFQGPKVPALLTEHCMIMAKEEEEAGFIIIMRINETLYHLGN